VFFAELLFCDSDMRRLPLFYVIPMTEITGFTGAGPDILKKCFPFHECLKIKQAGEAGGF
jgi:hypothetical protein